MSALHHLSAAWADADALRTKGQLAAARDLLEPVADVAAIRLGPDNPDVIETMRRLAIIHRELGELASARRVLEEALEGAQLRFADDDAVVLGISAELGAIADELGNRHEARKNFTRVATYGPAAFGPQHPYVQAAQQFLGLVAPPTEPAPDTQATFPPPQPAPPWQEPAAGEWPATQEEQVTRREPIEEEPGVYRPPWPLPETTEPRPTEPRPTEPRPTEPRPTEPRPTEPRPTEPRRAGTRAGRHQALEPEPSPKAEPAPAEPAPRLEHAALPWYQQPEPVREPEQQPVDPFAALDAPSRFETGSQPAGGPPRSSTPLIVLGVVSLAAVVAATVVGLVVLLSPRPVPQVGTGPGASVDASTTSTTPGAAPTNVQLRDDGSSITLTWSDPSDGKAPFFIEVGKPGAQLQIYNKLPPGETKYSVVGLNPRLDYCFSVIAVYGANVVAPSNLVCTSRAGAASPAGR